MDRRQFMAAGAWMAATPVLAQAGSETRPRVEATMPSARVDFTHDGAAWTPREYAQRLHAHAMHADIAADGYSRGGAIEHLETTFARLLGKPAAIFMPTGTLANHIAVRTLADGASRVLVQGDSHLYNDSGDAATLLSGLNLVPMATADALSLDEVKRCVEQSRGGRVETRLGVLSIETPVRRRDHALVPFETLQRVCAYARGEGIRLHLDGARLFNLPQHSGHSVREYAALFDTVYVSLWKQFDGTSGAILAGDASIIEGLHHARRMFGGALPQAWPQVALVAQSALDYEARYAEAWRRSERLLALLQTDGRFEAVRIADGTSRFFMRIDGNAARWVERLSAHGIVVAGPHPGTGLVPMQVNVTLSRREPDAIARAMVGALDG